MQREIRKQARKIVVPETRFKRCNISKVVPSCWRTERSERKGTVSAICSNQILGRRLFLRCQRIDKTICSPPAIFTGKEPPPPPGPSPVSGNSRSRLLPLTEPATVTDPPPAGPACDVPALESFRSCGNGGGTGPEPEQLSAGPAAPRSSARGRRCSSAVAPSLQRSRSCPFPPSAAPARQRPVATPAAVDAPELWRHRQNAPDFLRFSLTFSVISLLTDRLTEQY